jgi:hypothetical protein
MSSFAFQPFRNSCTCLLYPGAGAGFISPSGVELISLLPNRGYVIPFQHSSQIPRFFTDFRERYARAREAGRLYGRPND